MKASIASKYGTNSSTVHMRTAEKRCTDFNGAVENILFVALMLLPYIAAGIIEKL